MPASPIRNMNRIPLAILGGSDRKPGSLPPSQSGRRLLAGVKGVDLEIGGRRLIDLLIERYRSSGWFEPIYVAGPADAYDRELTDAELIDTDSGFGTNVEKVIAVASERHPGQPLAMSTCDILPELSELESLLQDYHSRTPTDLWFPLIQAPENPEQLGASSWKPRYRVIPGNGTSDAKGHPPPSTSVLPGHLTVFDPQALRRTLVFKLADASYRTRNRSVLYRRAALMREIILGLLLQDLRLFFSLRLPHVTWDVVRSGYATARRLRDGQATQNELETALRKIFTRRSHRLRHPERQMWLPILDGLSIARDIDTHEEASALEASVSPSPA